MHVCNCGVRQFADPPAASQPGDRITCEGYDGEPDESINPTKKNNAWTGVADVRASLSLPTTTTHTAGSLCHELTATVVRVSPLQDLYVENGVATYKGVPLVTPSGPCKPASITSGQLS